MFRDRPQPKASEKELDNKEYIQQIHKHESKNN